MRRRQACRRWLPALVPAIAAVAITSSSCGGGGDGPTAPPPPPTPNPGSASFRLVGAGEDGDVSYGGGSNLVFCRRQGSFADLWIRFAEQAAGNGENGPHLDLDVCNPGDGGSFSAMHPQAAACGGGQTFDIWWHGESAVFVNTAMPPSCSLTLMRNGTRLSGTFSCLGMEEFGGGNGSIDVLDGSFECTEE
jgi:hypothetical protein